MVKFTKGHVKKIGRVLRKNRKTSLNRFSKVMKKTNPRISERRFKRYVRTGKDIKRKKPIRSKRKVSSRLKYIRTF